MKEHEQRKTPRFQSEMPVVTGCGCKGMIRDFSNTGVFFETDGSLSPGQPIEFSIILEHLYPGNPVCLKCTGAIVRVEKSGQRIGVATTIDSYSIEDHHP